MFLNLTPPPKITPNDQKIAPKGPKKVQKRPKMRQNLEQKVRDVLPKPKLIDKNIFEPDPDSKNSPKGPKNGPKGPKKCKKCPKFGQI